MPVSRRAVVFLPLGGLVIAQPARVRDRSFSDTQLEQLERRVFDLVNERRKSRKLLPLVWSAQLSTAARRHSLAMLEGDFFSHNDPLRGGLEKRLNEAKVPWKACAENLFTQQGRRDPVSKAVEVWMDSSGHRANILDKTYTDSGVGMMCAENGAWFATQIFALLLPTPEQN